jgi:uncharacterized peroxidase-related enzyme
LADFADTEWEERLLEPRKDPELEREVRKAYGIVPPAVRFLAPCPWLVRAVARSNFHNGALAHIDLILGELIFLAVSQDNSCRYCYAGQRAQLRIQGFDEERIRRLEDASFSAEGDRRESAALDFARRLSRANPAPGSADKDALREVGYSDDAIKEIAYMAAYAVWANRTTTLVAAPLDEIEGLEDRWYARLFRPFLARVLRSRQWRGKPEHLAPELKTGPFAQVAVALDGSPTARVWREVLALAWGSTVLSSRAKTLVFAVVARGLASERVEQEARGLLADEGLDSAALDEVLSHLASPELDRVESIIVPFARETIWYRPAEIQRRARKLREVLTLEELVELIGVVGLANATCRLSLVLGG